MNFKFDVLATTSSHREPHLWLVGGDLDTEAERRDLFLLTDLAIKTDSQSNAENAWLKDLLSLGSFDISCHFRADSHPRSNNESHLAIRIWKANNALCGDIHIKLNLKRDEVLFLSNKLDFQRLLGSGSVHLDLYVPLISSDVMIAFLSESRNSKSSRITKSREFKISGFKIIAG
jgi:hypothetical protein